MNKLLLVFSSFCLLFISFLSYSGGLTLGGTRLIYPGNQKEASISISNSEINVPYLVQVWVSDMQHKTENIPFIANPPLFKLSQDRDSFVRVAYTSIPLLPEDRESVFLLNVRNIPAVEKKDDPQRLTIATQNIIKLIYRPKSLTGIEASLAWNKLDVLKSDQGIIFSNPTPYVITLSGMSVDGKEIERPGILMPKSQKVISIDNAKNIRQVTYGTITDFGSLTTLKTVKF